MNTLLVEFVRQIIMLLHTSFPASAADFTMPNYVPDYSESDDDDVIEVPYVKPTPPMIVLSASEDEDESADSELILETITKQSKSKTGPRSESNRTKDQRDHDVLNRSSEHTSKNTGPAKEKGSKKTRLTQSNKAKDTEVSNANTPEAISSSHKSSLASSNSSVSVVVPPNDVTSETPTEKGQYVEPGAAFVSLNRNDSGESSTRSSKIVTNSGAAGISSMNTKKDAIDDETDELTQSVHISTNTFDSGCTPSNSSALSKDNNVEIHDVLASSAVERTGVEPEQKGKKRARSANSSTSRSPKRKNCAKSAQEQSRSDLLKFMQHLGLPLQELPAMDTPARKRVAKKAKNFQAEVSTPTAAASSASSPELPVPNESRAFVSSTDDTAIGYDGVEGALQKKSRPPRKKTRSCDGEAREDSEDVVITQNDLDSINSKIQTNLVIPESASTKELVTQRSAKTFKSVDENQSTSSDRLLKQRKSRASVGVDRNELAQVGHPMSRTPESNGREAKNKNKTPKNIYPSKWDEKMIKFYGGIKDADVQMSDIQSKQRGSSSIWRAPEDTSTKRKKCVRRVRCDNCNQMGHLKHECLDTMKPSICTVCGCEGHSADDSHFSCPNSLCLNCGERQSRFQKACEKCVYQSRPIKCSVCEVIGHADTFCPDIWRRYHSTTSIAVSNQNVDIGGSQTESKKKVYKPAFSVHCANCGVRGHNYYRCKVPRYSHSYPHKPYVIKELPNPITLPTPDPVASVVSEESPKQRKVTPVMQSTNVVESLTIQIENSVVVEAESNVEIPPEPDVSTTHESPSNPDVNFEMKTQVIITLNPAEHNILLRAVHEKKTDELFKNNIEREVDIQILRDQREVHLYGFEEGVDQARLDIFKLLFELKTTELRNKKDGKDRETSTRNQTIARADPAQTLPLESVSTREDLSSKASDSHIVQGDGVGRNKETTSRGQIVNLGTASSTNSFQEDEIPNMFDVDERISGDESKMRNMSVFHPRGPFGPARIKEYIPIPVPVPVPVSEYASFTAGSGTGQDFGTFGNQSFPLAFARAYYQSSLKFPQLPQVRPTVFEPPVDNISGQSSIQGSSELASKSVSPSLLREESPELEIIGELSGKDKTKEQAEKPKDNMLLLKLSASERDFIYLDKTDLLLKISKVLELNISLDMKTNVISIKGGCKKKRKVAQHNIFGFLEAKKAGTPYIISLTCKTKNSEDRPSSPEESESKSQDRHPNDDESQVQDTSHIPPLFPTGSHSQVRQAEYGHHRRNLNSSHFRNYQEYDARRGGDTGSYFQPRYRNNRHPYHNYRNYQSNEGGEGRYERNNYRPRPSGRSRGSRPTRPQRYFDTTN